MVMVARGSGYRAECLAVEVRSRGLIDEEKITQLQCMLNATTKAVTSWLCYWDGKPSSVCSRSGLV